MRLQEQVFKAYQDQTSSNMEACRKGALAAKEALEHSPLYWNGILDKRSRPRDTAFSGK